MTSMKGLLKGLRYISQIFDNEKEEEIQIGFPTDVKHVAHIGMDGPSANTPSWMNEFKPGSGVSSNEPKDKHASKSSEPLTQDIMDPPKLSGASLDSPTRRNSSKTKQSRRNHSSSAGSMGSPTRDSSGTSKPRSHKNSIDLDSSTRGSSTTSKPRRRKNSTDLDSPTRDSSTRSRRSHHPNIESDSPSHDPPGVPKQSRRKKSKGSSSGGLSKSSRSKGSDSTESYPDSGLGHGSKDDSLGPNSVLEVYEEGNECDELSRGIRAL